VVRFNSILTGYNRIQWQSMVTVLCHATPVWPLGSDSCSYKWGVFCI